MFSRGSFRSISLATVTPSFVMVGDPYFLSITTFRRLARAVVPNLAGARGDDLAFLRLLLGGVGDDDSAHFLFAFIKALDDDAVVKRSDIHGFQLQIDANVWIVLGTCQAMRL